MERGVIRTPPPPPVPLYGPACISVVHAAGWYVHLYVYNNIVLQVATKQEMLT